MSEDQNNGLSEQERIMMEEFLAFNAANEQQIRNNMANELENAVRNIRTNQPAEPIVQTVATPREVLVEEEFPFDEDEEEEEEYNEEEDYEDEEAVLSNESNLVTVVPVLEPEPERVLSKGEAKWIEYKKTYLEPRLQQLREILEAYYPNRWDLVENSIVNTATFHDQYYKDGINTTQECYSAIIYFPEITISNGGDTTHRIYDTYIKIAMNYRLRTIDSTFYLTRTKQSYLEHQNLYRHSHANRTTDRWSHMCLGSTPLQTLLMDLRSTEFDVASYEMLLIQLPDYLSWESLDGGPYFLYDQLNYETLFTAGRNRGLPIINHESDIFDCSKKIREMVLEENPALKGKLITGSAYVDGYNTLNNGCTNKVVNTYNFNIDMNEDFHFICSRAIESLGLSSLLCRYDPDLKIYLNSDRELSLEDENTIIQELNTSSSFIMFKGEKIYNKYFSTRQEEENKPKKEYVNMCSPDTSVLLARRINSDVSNFLNYECKKGSPSKYLPTKGKNYHNKPVAKGN